MAVRKLLALGVLSVLVLVVMLSSPADGCTCMPVHPQTQYCNAEYVILARIVKKSARPLRGRDVYKIAIKNAYKVTEQAQSVLKHGRITTPSWDSMCGIKLKEGKLYVIAGTGPEISICDYYKEYFSMTIVERRGFAGAYQKGCSCNIQRCYRGDCGRQQTGGYCNWTPFATCETDFGACIPTRGSYTKDEKPLKCHWRRSPPYKKCLTSLRPNAL